MEVNRFLVWRPSVGAYMMYTAVYNDDGQIIKFVSSDLPNGQASLHEYSQAYTHNIPLKVGDGHVRFFDLVERSCMRFVEEFIRADGLRTFSEVEIPVLEFERHQILPRELGCSTLQVA